MKRIATALSGLALLTVIAVEPLSAQQLARQSTTVQIAETRATPTTSDTVRNAPTLVRRDILAATREDDGKSNPPGAQALMVLGIALIVSPAMFRGAFSN